jgi:hypothetical protein
MVTGRARWLQPRDHRHLSVGERVRHEAQRLGDRDHDDPLRLKVLEDPIERDAADRGHDDHRDDREAGEDQRAGTTTKHLAATTQSGANRTLLDRAKPRRSIRTTTESIRCSAPTGEPRLDQPFSSGGVMEG